MMGNSKNAFAFGNDSSLTLTTGSANGKTEDSCAIVVSDTEGIISY